MSQLSAFVGHSFTEEDQQVIETILKYLDQVKNLNIGFSWQSAEPAEPKDPGSNETYRVAGSATISTDPELLKRFEVRGKPPRVVMVVAVDEAFNHCPKAFVRAKLWDATERPSHAPSHGDFAAARDGKDAAYARDYNEKYAERLKTELY